MDFKRLAEEAAMEFRKNENDKILKRAKKKVSKRSRKKKETVEKVSDCNSEITELVKELNIVSETNTKYNYRNLECNYIKIKVSTRFRDQIKFVCNTRKITISELIKNAIVEYLMNHYPRDWDNSRMYVKKIEEEYIRGEKEIVEDDDRDE